MSYKPPRRPQFFYTTAPLPCPYVDGRIERKVVTEIAGPDAEGLHDRLSRAGFRRSHNIAYAPVCPGCNSCVPIRIPVGACLTDRLGDGLSAVYSFFLPGLERRSLGTFTILWLIERAKALALPYVYLGYWVPESRKMAYKARFRPCEVLSRGAWRVLKEGENPTAFAESELVTETAG